MKKSKYLKAVKDCLRWTEKVMLTFDRGYWGVYERIRIDQNERVCHCRPDCSSELARVLQSYRETAGDERYNDVYENQIHWLQRVQNGEDKTNAGSFPFAMADGTRKYYEISITFPNDNGKVILNLCCAWRSRRRITGRAFRGKTAVFTTKTTSSSCTASTAVRVSYSG